MAFNAHFWTLNESRPYPVDDSATMDPSHGVEKMPMSVLVDARISVSGDRVPVFVSSMAITDKIVSLTFESGESFGPIGSLVIAQPAAEGVPHPIRPFRSGVAGWVVLGSGVRNKRYSGRFNSESGLLAPRVVFGFPSPPVRSLGGVTSLASLTGDVEIIGRDDIRVSVEQRFLDGGLRSAVVLSLIQGDERINEIGVSESVYDVYAGPCSSRPENGTCGAPYPIENIAGVMPDNDGMITIRIVGEKSSIGPSVGDNALFILHSEDVSDVCKPPDSWEFPSSGYEGMCFDVMKGTESDPFWGPPKFEDFEDVG